MDVPADIRETVDAIFDNVAADESVADAVARALLTERERAYINGLESAAKEIHCGCVNYCDFDEAEDKIRRLIRAIRA